MNLDNVEYGGTGFYYPEKAPNLPNEIEHIKPDYDLYKSWADDIIASSKDPAKERKRLTYFYDYSIGFLTRHCFRKCWFCVNKHYDKCIKGSEVLEFYDESRPKLCFLDDNFFGFPKWQELINEVKKLGKRFQFKQGLDERLLMERHIHEIMTWKYDGDYIFAFDNIADSELIESKLKLLYTLYPNFKKRLKFYVFCGACDEGNIYEDVENIFKRCFVLAKYSAVPYIMRYETIYKSRWSSLYATIAAWCNQPSFFKKKSFRQYAMERGMSNELHKIYKTDTERYLKDGHKKGGTWTVMEFFEEEFPRISKYYDTAGDMLLKYGNGKRLRRMGKMNVFLICPVRNATQEQLYKMNAYIENLKKTGASVYYPANDTDQNDKIGYRICSDNRVAISIADEVHIFWDTNSQGSLFDLGMAFALNKKIVIANKDEVEKTDCKSFSNMITHWSERKQ